MSIVDKALIVEAAKKLNGIKVINEDSAEVGLLEKSIKVVAVKEEDLIKSFLEACESVPVDKEDLIPDDVAAIYNKLANAEQNPPAGDTAPPAEKKPENKPPKAAAGAEKKTGETTEKGGRPKGSLGDVKPEIAKMIAEAKYTGKQIIEEMVKKYGVKTTSVYTILTDSKNPKYNKFDKLVVADANGVLSFAKK